MNVRIRKCDRMKSAWNIPGIGLYQQVRLGFGLRNAPSYFCQVLNTLFQSLHGDKIQTFLDDIIIAGNTVPECLESLERVLEKLRVGGLKVSPTKCDLMKSKVFFLGAWISEAGYEADQNKVQAIVNLPFPSTTKKLMSWLGMINWFRILLKNAAAELKPMKQLPDYYFHGRSSYPPITRNSNINQEQITK